jgi:hypothetical protein
MEYGLLLTLDQQYEPIGLFSFETTVGSIVVVFTDGERLQSAALAAADATEQQGTKVGSTTIEAESAEDLMSQLLGLGWNSEEGNLVMDTDPLGQQLIEQLVQA